MDTNNARLDGYFANVSRRKKSVSDWRIYAAVTGSAMAMATNASAGVIYFNQPVTVGPIGNVAQSSSIHQSQSIALKSVLGGNIGYGLKIKVWQFSVATGYAGGVSVFGLPNTVKNNFLVLDSNRLKKLAFGANISAAVALGWQTQDQMAFRNISSGLNGWAPSATGFAGFRFSTTNHALDYGWIRLSYTLGTNGSPNSVTAIDWAYDPTGAPVSTGEGAAPEPSTTALAIMAAGAAGVAALRRRRQAAGETACPTFSDRPGDDC